MKKFDRFCFICEKRVTGAMTGNLKQAVEDPPNDAMCWTSHGNFGSTVYDDFDGKYLEICICDDCFKQKSNKKNTLEVKPLKVSKYTVNRYDWKGE